MERPGAPASETTRRLDPTDPWARRWAPVAGIALLVNFVVPWSSWRYAWPWDVLKDANWDRAIHTFKWPALGVLALVLRRWANPKTMGIVLTSVAAIVILDEYDAFRWKTTIWVPGMNLQSIPVPALLPVFLGFPLLVAGNHLRRLHPDRTLPRLLPHVGAALLLIGLLIPIHAGRPLAQLLVDAEHWRTNWAFHVVLAATFAMGLIGLLPPSREHPNALPAVLSVAARVLAVAIPLAFLATAYASGDPEWVEVRARGIWMPVLMIGKWCVEDLASLVLLAVGLVSWVDFVLRARAHADSRASPSVLGGIGSASA